MVLSEKSEELSNGVEETEDGSFEGRFEQRVMKRERRREVNAVIKLMANASKTTRGYATEQDFVDLFKGLQRKAVSRKRRLGVIETAGGEMRETFGVEIILDEGHSSTRYYLRQLRTDELADDVSEVVAERNATKTDEAHYKDGLLCAALTHIFLEKKHQSRGEKGVSKRALERFMAKTTQLGPEGFARFFGPTKTAVFLAQGFLRYDPETGRYDWGSRADAIVDKQEVLCRFCDIYGSGVHNWPQHAKAAGFNDQTMRQFKKRNGDVERGE